MLQRLRQRNQAATPIPSPADFICSLTIENPQGGDEVSIIPFSLWPEQRSVIQALRDNRLVIVLKARQLGISWLCDAFALWLCLFFAVRTVLIFSKGLDEAEEMVRRIAGMYNRIPEAQRAKLPSMTGNTTELSFSNGSRVNAMAATKTAGSSYTASLVIADEFAKMMWADDLYTSMKPTIDGGGKLIIVSTAKGKGNRYYKLWEGAAAGTNNYKPIFLSWRARPGRDDAWYAAVAKDATSDSLLKQEYPETPEEAFNASSTEKFLQDMWLWDRCNEALPAQTPREPMVLAMDAGVTNDSFALIGVTRHPDPARHDDIAVRYVREWKPPRSGALDFGAPGGPEEAVRAMCKRGSGVNVVHLCYDPYQLHDMATRLQREGVVLTKPFNQAGDRLEADKALLDVIMGKRIAHNGDAALRAHIDNADRKPDAETRKLRIVKREEALKIDLAVALSMAAYRCSKLPL